MSSPVEQFHEWRESINPELRLVEKLLAQEISDEPEKLIGDLRTIEAHNGRIGFILAQAESHLDTCQFFLMPGKEGVTEFERKITLECEVSDMRKWRNRIESISDAIKTRITLGQSILKYMSQFIEPSMKRSA